METVFNLISTNQKEEYLTNQFREIKILCFVKDVSFVKNSVTLNILSPFKDLYDGYTYSIRTTNEIFEHARQHSDRLDTPLEKVNKLLEKDTISLLELNTILRRVYIELVF